jgi:hypothetical protein
MIFDFDDSCFLASRPCCEAVARFGMMLPIRNEAAPHAASFLTPKPSPEIPERITA